ncbi:hypothetical protein ACFY0G_44010 [Streptomyces sp. NPDC001552]|uniref:hypothetical protein n=1 Tax=Streptomyces sp. NPDC001552 TaxID=3364587 RepID=UPI00369F2381
MGNALLDSDGNPLPAPETASLDLLIRTLGIFSSLADEMDREPHSFTVHGDVLLAQFGRVEDVAQWVGLAATALRRDLLGDLGRVPAAGEPPADPTGAGLSGVSPELIERVLAVCEPHYAAVTGTSSAQWDRELSRELVGLAQRTVRLADREAYPQVLEEYLVAHRARLEKLWHVYGPDGVFPQGVYHLVELPVSFVLCERIDRARMWLKGVWGRECESDTPLERLEEAWLYGTSESDGR